MPKVIEYCDVLAQAKLQKLQCLYHNSGSFGFAQAVPAFPVGWIGPQDTSIRPEAQPSTRSIPRPYERNLSELAIRLWRDRLDGPVWLMPKSHWHYELQFGSREWLPDLLSNIGVDPALLVDRNNAAALEFSNAEEALAALSLARLLEMLQGSDFALLFPNWPLVSTVHHHKQLWWVTTDRDLASHIQSLPRSLADGSP